MRIVILREQLAYSLEDLASKFGYDNTKLIQAMSRLSLMGFVKHINRKINLDLEDLLDIQDIDSLEADFNEGGYVFTCVGMILVDNVCLIVYPKYVTNYMNDENENYKLIKQIIEVIRHFQSKTLGFEGGFGQFNLLSFALDLFDNYHINGLYRNDKEKIALNGQGQILWNKTLNSIIPYIEDHTPLYLDLYTSRKFNDYDNFFRRLHASLLTELSNSLKDLLVILDVEPIQISNEKLETFGETDYILYLLNQELSSQYVTVRQQMLKLIKTYFEANYFYSTSNNISFVATNYFHRIWEDVCSVVKKNNYKNKLKELNLEFRNHKGTDRISDIIAKPEWYSEKYDTSYVVRDTLIPDIVSIEDGVLSIYDAKYYKIILDDKKVAKQPGIGDITKQYLYELAYKDFINENQLRMGKNAFLMPSEEDSQKIIGHVSLDIFTSLDEIKCKEIEIILLPAQEMYREYLNFYS